VPDYKPADRVHHAETGFDIDPVYGPRPRGTWTAEDSLGAPGTFPFTRHIRVEGFRTRPWAPSLYAGFGTPEDANRRFRQLLAEGNGRANCAFDLPTQIGLDSDDLDAVGEVGRVGVAIDSLADFEVMFAGIPLDTVPVSLNVNATAPIILAMLVATAHRQGVDLADVSGTIANDILHEYIGRGTWRYPPAPSLRLAVDVLRFVNETMPRFFAFNIRGILLHESGASPAQEVGITFAIACRYIDEALSRGLAVDDFAPKMSFFFGTGLHLFEEAAKFRAARRLWARLLRDTYKATRAESQMMRFTSVAACGSHFTSVTPELNLVRGTLGCLAAALGGAQAMLGTTIDEAFDIPTEATQHLALRTQQIVALESDVCSTVDPLGGSYFVEAMTDAIEAAARVEFAGVGGSAGIVDAIEAGVPQAALAERAFSLASEIASGIRPVVGVNVYVDGDSRTRELQIHHADPSVEASRITAVSILRAERDAATVERALDAVRVAASGTESVMPSIIAAVEAYATVGEISSALEDVLGTYREPTAL